MKTTYVQWLVGCMLATLLFVSTVVGQAVYRVDFTGTWTVQSHPGNVPGGAHFSPLIGTTHDDSASLWEVGELASPGIERMAETGATTILRNEIMATPGTDTLLAGSGAGATGAVGIDFEVNADASLVTLVTMVAPSPDWFLGVSGFDLRPGGTWINSTTVDLFTYDSGTDSGPNFTSPNQDTNPAEPIALLGAPLAGTPALGTFEFTLLSVPEPSVGLPVFFGILGLLLVQRRRWVLRQRPKS